MDRLGHPSPCQKRPYRAFYEIELGAVSDYMLCCYSIYAWKPVNKYVGHQNIFVSDKFVDRYGMPGKSAMLDIDYPAGSKHPGNLFYLRMYLKFVISVSIGVGEGMGSKLACSYSK